MQKKQVQNSNQDSVVVYVPEDLQSLAMDLHQVQWLPIAPVGLYVTGGPSGPDILNTGVVPASKAPVLDITPAGDVEGLIDLGPLMTSEKPFKDFPLLF